MKTKKRKKTLIVFLVTVISLTGFFILFILWTPKQDRIKRDFEKKIIKNANKTITLTDVLEKDFEWDVVYIDNTAYASGESIKVRYGITGDFEMMDSDGSFRLAYCKNKKLVRDDIFYLSSDKIWYDYEIYMIYPDTKLFIEVVEYESGNEYKICYAKE